MYNWKKQDSVAFKLAHIAKADNCHTKADCINAKDTVWKVSKEAGKLTPAMRRRLNSLEKKYDKLHNKLRGY